LALDSFQIFRDLEKFPPLNTQYQCHNFTAAFHDETYNDLIHPECLRFYHMLKPSSLGSTQGSHYQLSILRPGLVNQSQEYIRIPLVGMLLDGLVNCCLTCGVYSFFGSPLFLGSKGVACLKSNT
jgi:hypothetical protein